MAAAKKVRLDALLTERGLAPTRTKARALILAGQVIVGEQRCDKPGSTFPEDAPIRIRGIDNPFVSRGGLKLDAALDGLKIEVADLDCLDVGISTGGFTDCLLQRGASRVILSLIHI